MHYLNAHSECLLWKTFYRNWCLLQLNEQFCKSISCRIGDFQWINTTIECDLLQLTNESFIHWTQPLYSMCRLRLNTFSFLLLAFLYWTIFFLFLSHKIISFQFLVFVSSFYSVKKIRHERAITWRFQVAISFIFSQIFFRCLVFTHFIF